MREFDGEDKSYQIICAKQGLSFSAKRKGEETESGESDEVARGRLFLSCRYISILGGLIDE
jgi:hypothetical protein